MVTTGADPVFVDTNVLVYSNTASSPWYVQAQSRLTALDGAGVPLWISRQILREYLATRSRPQSFTQPVPAATLTADISRFEIESLIAEEGALVTSNLLSLLRAIPIGGRQVPDANIVATMQAHGITQLLTHNAADFARFVPWITVLPL